MRDKSVDKTRAGLATDAGVPGGAVSEFIRRRPYTPPRILSIEPLEVAAAACDPPTGGFGKDVGGPFGCTTLGS